MSQRNVLILERSSKNLQKVDDKGKVVLEGVFAEFGVENRNGRVYEEKEYLPHLEYLKKDMSNGSLLGELDHPERFEVALGNVSHRVNELWYDQAARQIKGRIEVLDTPKGQIAKSLLEAGVPLSISSRAAGTVNEDKTVQIQQIYTYDLVAKPGFEAAQLKTVNESAKARVGDLITKLNESASSRDDHDISDQFGIMNENISILDLTDKFPSVKLREEAIALQKESKGSTVKNKSEETKMEQDVKESALQQWTVFFKNELSKINERLDKFEGAMLEGTSGNSAGELKLIKQYVEKMREANEDHKAWTGEIAKAVNEVASYADTLAEKSNKHYKLTQKVVETVDENAKVLNHTQDWVGNNAEVTNAIAETVDHNAKMLNGINEWNNEIARGVNELHEWGTEKAKAINGIHEWTSSIAKNLNETANWSEDMFGRAMSKDDAKKLIEYVELVSESKSNPEAKAKLDEALEKHGITGQPLTEGMLTGIKGVKGLGVITDVKKTGNEKVDTKTTKDSGVEVEEKSKTIVAKMKKAGFSKSAKPKELKTLDKVQTGKVKIGKDGKALFVLDKTKTIPQKAAPSTGVASEKSQNLKLDTKPEGKVNEETQEVKLGRTEDLKARSSKLDEKLSSIISKIEIERKVDETVKTDFPFTALLSESDRKAFAELSLTEKQSVAHAVKENPTTDSGVIKALWENALATEKKKAETKEPKWLAAAPKGYRELFESAPEIQQEAIKARAEFYDLNTDYQITNFWQVASGLNPADKKVALNEVFTAKDPKESTAKMDSYVAGIGEMMKKYQR